MGVFLGPRAKDACAPPALEEPIVAVALTMRKCGLQFGVTLEITVENTMGSCLRQRHVHSCTAIRPTDLLAMDL